MWSEGCGVRVGVMGVGDGRGVWNDGCGVRGGVRGGRCGVSGVE